MPTQKQLPSNVRRWLERAMPDEIPTPRKIVNTQRGTINVRDSWTPFTGTTTYQADPFSFHWQGRIQLLPLVWLQARDYHAGQSGGGSTKFWGLIPMGGREDPTAYRMQVIRNLAELPWMPSFALAIPNLEWKDQGELAFVLHARLAELDIVLTFELNEAGDVLRVHGERHYDTPVGYALAPWNIEYTHHKVLNGMRVPATAVATYEKPDGRWEYFRAELDDLRLE